MLALETIQRAKGKINIITLQPLDLIHVNQLLADTFDDEPEQTKPLAELVFNKTAGNPFFLTQLLKSLYQENIVFFDFSDNRWKWDIGLISQVAIASNVVELMVGQLQKLPSTTQSALEYAACIGNQFNLQTLSTICEKSPSATEIALWEAVQVGLILPLNDTSRIQLVLEQLDEESNSDFLQTEYKFLHDRVQQAAYGLIPEDQKKETHLKVGQLLLKNTEQHHLEIKIFDIVNQLNLGVDLITQLSKRDELARLNLIAGRKAKAATAYEIAAGYIRTGLSLLTPESWQYQYELTLPLYTEGVEWLCCMIKKWTRLALKQA
jgi:predicted ATPase